MLCALRISGASVVWLRLTMRLTERDKVKMGECFRLGDIVKAKVVSTSCTRWMLHLSRGSLRCLQVFRFGICV